MCTTGLIGIIGIICKIGELFSYIIPVLVSLGVIYFIWGVIQYMIGDSEEAKTKGRDTILYGIIGLTVIIAMWGLVEILKVTFLGRGDVVAPSGAYLRDLLPR